MSVSTNSIEIRPGPKQPPLKEYEHLSEKERMIAGYPYKPWDAELIKERLIARKLTKQLNDAAVEDEECRKEILKKLLHPNTHESVFFEPGNFRCDYGYNITIGEGAYINFDCCFLDCASITIGKRAFFAPNIHIYAATHPLDPFERRDFELAKPVKIGDDCWIGGKVIICPGVTIGDGVTIGAGSIVTKDIPSNVVVAGNPAKIIRYLAGYNSGK